MLNKINSLIAQRAKYGIRQETTQNPGYILIWSNASAEWGIYGDKHNKGKILNLDANQIFISGNKKDIVAVLEQLNPLPLYHNSFEFVSIKAV